MSRAFGLQRLGGPASCGCYPAKPNISCTNPLHKAKVEKERERTKKEAAKHLDGIFKIRKK